jgi:predicted esterase
MMSAMRKRSQAWLVVVVAATACVDRKAPGPATIAPDAAASTGAAEPEASVSADPSIDAPPPPAPSPQPPAIAERVAVPGDLPAFIVRSATGSAPRIVFVPGVCSNAYGYVAGFPEAARRAGGVVAIDGDLPCPGAPGFRSFSWDIAKAQKRIDAALAAAGHVDVNDALVAIGYSQGAAILEQLVAKSPERYARVVLIAAPSDPIPSRYAKARAVVTMACSRDVVSRMKLASKAIGALGVPSTYIEMPGCFHGEIADGDARFGEAFAWLDEHR